MIPVNLENGNKTICRRGKSIRRTLLQLTLICWACLEHVQLFLICIICTYACVYIILTFFYIY